MNWKFMNNFIKCIVNNGRNIYIFFQICNFKLFLQNLLVIADDF